MAKDFDENKHPRDKECKFTSKQGNNIDGLINKYSDTPKEDKESIGFKTSGGISGALDYQGKDKKRADKHASLLYETFRRIKSDVNAIAKNTGFSIEEISQIKNHMFFNKYNLHGVIKRFDEDFEQAQSWDRLRKNEALEIDIILLKHELEESKLMAQGIDYITAHKEANKIANYEKELLR